MRKKSKIQKREVPRIEYFISCPECNEEIKGGAVSQVDYNLMLHLQKHKREAKKK